MEQVIRSLIVIGIFVSGASALACNYPGDPDFLVPEGAVASKEEMIDTQGQVKAYVSSIEEYLGCLDKNLAAVGSEGTEEQRAIYTLRYNAAVDSMELIADRFNAALQAYKAAN